MSAGVMRVTAPALDEVSAGAAEPNPHVVDAPRHMHFRP